MSRALNFNAGPAALPLPALERARDELLDFKGSGMSVMEHSHRGKEYEGVHDEAIALLRELYAVPDDYDILLLQGGASTQFAVVPMNLLGKGDSCGYILSGAWGEKAVAEAKVVAAQLGSTVEVVGNSGTGEGKAKGYARVPTKAEIKSNTSAKYVHCTSNETIHGVQFGGGAGSEFPSTGGVPLVCDMSSDILSRRIDVSSFGLIYAGAQKNLGPSGVTVVIVKKSLVAEGRKDIPIIFQYRTHEANNSLYNTPPTFGIYLLRNVLSWVKSSGGLPQIEAWNKRKGELLYGTIDAHADFFRSPVDKASRSLMNVVFRLPSDELEQKFLDEAKKRRMVGLKGHRSVGGIRASTYNAVTVEWVEELCSFMTDFAKSNGSK